MENIKLVVGQMTDEELAEIAGGVDPCGWICTYTLDCPGTRWYSCC
ncbi:type A2 lanthipeptide [Effusibacillus consociatus]|uniref:Lantibiotic n=1 Tax=Effusibacillus consociatus TaxID=1117041 RepID=A0ABV9Q4Z7_9BACL